MVYELLQKKLLFEEENRPSFMRITEKSIGLKLCSMHVPNSGLHSRTHSLMTLKVRAKLNGFLKRFKHVFIRC